MSDPPRPVAVSLFSGAGGMDIGLERAGFHVVAANDHDRDCVETLRANQRAAIPVAGAPGRSHLEGTRLLHAAVEDVGGADLRPRGARGRWVPDLLVGGPPCQPFSSAGLMATLRDPRGMLFVHFVRLARRLRPRTILFENVRGLVTARGPLGVPGEALTIVRDAFEEIGYATTFALLNAADYGLPQRRVRLFMMATRCTALPEFPEPTHGGDAEPGTDREPWVTLGEFLRGRPPPAEREVVRPGPRLASQLADLPPGGGLKSPGKKETTRPGGHCGYKQGTFIADPSLPARTVTAATTQDWIREADGSLRRLTLAEVSASQGFLESWRFEGSKASRFRQVGNAVPPPIAELLGRSLVTALGSGPRRRPQSAPLPARFAAAIAYTKREQARNGASRAAGQTVVRAAS